VPAARVFSLEEANALVPRLTLLIGRLQQAALGLREQMESFARSTGREPDGLTTEELLRHQPAARALVTELDTVVHDIEESGAELKDVQLGLVDFPARINGEVVYLCWQFGEPEVAFWHRMADGFAGRRALPGSSRPPSLQ
jgi:hypothetical protein